MCMTGCNPKPVGQSTRWTIGDVEAMTHEMAQSLRDSVALANRGPDSEPWTVSMDKVLNLSDEVMTPNEQWSIMAQVRGAADIQALWDEKAVRFVIPPERVVQLRNSEYGYDFDDSFAQNRKVTHTLTATFRSLTRAQAKQRSDLYYCEFEILDFATHEPVWTDKFEFKRSAKGARVGLKPIQHVVSCQRADLRSAAKRWPAFYCMFSGRSQIAVLLVLPVLILCTLGCQEPMKTPTARLAVGDYGRPRTELQNDMQPKRSDRGIPPGPHARRHPHARGRLPPIRAAHLRRSLRCPAHARHQQRQNRRLGRHLTKTSRYGKVNRSSRRWRWRITQ